MVSLNDLRSAAVALDWHEALAAGAALAALVAQAQAPACPRPADVTLLPSGELRVSGPGHIDAPAAAGVAVVLAQLLDAAPCPAELRQRIEHYAADDRIGAAGAAAVAELVSELAFFERPNRREVLAAVALRAAPALERAQRAAALEALTERTRLAAGGTPVVPLTEPQPHPSILATPAAAPIEAAPRADAEAAPGWADAAPGWERADDGGLRRMAVPAAVGLAAFLAVAYVAASWIARSPAPAPRVDAVEEDLPISGAAPPPAEASSASAPQPRPSPPRERAPGTAPPAPADATPAAATPTAPAPAVPPAARSVDVVVAERGGRVVASPIAPVHPAPRPAASGRVFQSGDPQVTPAVLIRPRLPDRPPPDVPEEQIGTLEFIVAETGAVEHVHLVSPTNRFQERMLVAAAKAWQFQPAMYDGRPVRFRTRIRVPL